MFDAVVTEDQPEATAPKIVRDLVLPELYTLEVAPVLSAAQARSLIGMLMRYSMVKKLHINTH